MVIWLSRYVTISVLREVKELLEREKGKRGWSEFLLELYWEAKRGRGRAAFSELRRLLDDGDFEGILRSSREFRRGFRLG